MKYNRPLQLAAVAAFLAQAISFLNLTNAQDRVSVARVPAATRSANLQTGTASLGSDTIAPVLISTWPADDVALWAAKNSPAANLLEAERAALGQLLDCKDEEQRAQIGLVQAVSREMALHSRQEAAADALDVYFEAKAIVLQMEVLSQAKPRLDALEALAKKAQKLELPDGDPDEMEDRRMIMEDRWFQADLGLQRLRNQLAGLIGQDHVTAETALFPSQFPTAEYIELTPEAHIPEALAKRRDLKAIETLCRCTTSKTLPAAKQLLSALAPGLGIQVAAASGGCGLLGLHKNDDDLGARKAQCQRLAQARREQIQTQVRDAIFQLREATCRLQVARDRAELHRKMAASAARAIQLDQKPVGSDHFAELEYLERQAEVIAREAALAKAIVKLNRVKGSTIAQ